jgi:AmiR/NasT family two-component response regulator
MPVIEQAKGILMAQHRCGADEAFDLLRRAVRAECAGNPSILSAI